MNDSSDNLDPPLTSPLLDDEYIMDQHESMINEQHESQHDDTTGPMVFMATPNDTAPTTISWTPAQILAMLSNFSTSYNVVNISLVLPMLKHLYAGTSEDFAACASSLLAGMMIGQVLGGALGDSSLGRLGALTCVMALQIAASLASAMVTGPGSNIYTLLAVTRLFLGIGAGGVYPLAAVMSAEQGTKTLQDPLAQLSRVVLTFSMQGIGFLAVPVTVLPLLYLTDESQLDIVWRLVLGLGSLPGIILMILQWKIYRKTDRDVVPQSEEDADSVLHDIDPSFVIGDIEEEEDQNNSINMPASTPGLWSALKTEPRLFTKVLGTAGTWFLFDVLFYGNTLFQPIVMEAAFGTSVNEDSGLKKAATDSLILAMIALPGYIVSALVIGKRLCYIQQTPRHVQLQGFFAMALLYAIIGAYWGYLKRLPSLLVLVYGMTFFFANYGPNTTTFVFPSLVFSPECRSTLNGIAAASGKAGALVGATLFAPTADAFGDSAVMLICAGVAVVAFGLTFCFAEMPDTSRLAGNAVGHRV